MRVIAGRFGGVRLAAPPGMGTRPMTDRVKETLFNVLGTRLAAPGLLPAIDVLDVFAGSGALGLEALSRGAEHCLFVERGRPALRTLRENIAALSVAPCCAISTENAWTMRIPAARGDAGYGLVFCDPPFRDVADATRALDLLERLAPRLAQNGLIVFRHDAPHDLPLNGLRGLACLDQRAWGRNRVLLLGQK